MNEELQKLIKKAKYYINTNFKHKGYDEKTKLRNLYLQFITGENIDDLLPQFERYETNGLWQQRKSITIENLSPICARVLNYFYKVSRTPKNKSITSVTQAEQKNQLLQDAIEHFYGEASLEDYLTQTLDILSIVDPNAFISYDVYPFKDGEVPKIYPVIFDSEDVLDFGFANDGNLSYLFTKVESCIIILDNNQAPTDKNEEVVDYYLFAKGYLVNFIEKTESRPAPAKATENVFDSANGKKYYVIINETGSKKVKNQIQATQIGYIKHKKHKMLWVSPLHPAKPKLLEIIRRKSGLDLSVEKHVHPQLFMFSEKCKGEMHKNENRKCIGGKIAGTNDDCTVCGGDGLKPIRSAQEYIKVPIPNKTDANIPIDKWAYYNSVDEFPVTYLDQRCRDLEADVLQCVFNSDHTQKVSGNLSSMPQQTATEVYLKRDAINNTLKPFAQNRRRIFKFYGNGIGNIFDVEATVVYEYTTEKFEPITFEELTATLKALMDAGADEILIENIQMQLAVLALDNDQDKIKSYKLKRKFLPFRGKSSAQIDSLLSLEIVPQETKILWANFNIIWEAVESNEPAIYDKEYKEVIGLIETQVNYFKSKIDKEKTANMVGLTATNKLLDNGRVTE